MTPQGRDRKFWRLRESRRSLAATELFEEKVEAIRASRFDARRAYLDGTLDRVPGV